MYTALDSVTLSSGEQMEIGVVRCPDPSWAQQVKPFLSHKGREPRDFFEAAFERPMDDLETRFYIGTIGGLVVTNVMVVGTSRSPAAGVGILGHVYTTPAHRQKGAYGRLMQAQMADIRRAGYRAITLGTGFETHPYWIYHKHGFWARLRCPYASSPARCGSRPCVMLSAAKHPCSSPPPGKRTLRFGRDRS